jgi:hypothetical protein
MINRRKKVMQGKLPHFLKLMMHFFGNLSSKKRGVKILQSAPDEYKCQCCGETKPLNKDHFQTVKSFKYGFSTYCLECDIITRKIKPKD